MQQRTINEILPLSQIIYVIGKDVFMNLSMRYNLKKNFS
jgi:hypothetical protein